MAVLYEVTTHYGIRYYKEGSDTSSEQVERHAAETIDNAIRNTQEQITGTIYSVSVPVPGIDVGVSDEVPLWAAPGDCTLESICFIPKSMITGADTDYFTLSVLDKGNTGTGTDEIVSLAFPLGVDAAAFTAKGLGTLSETHKILAQGDVISFKKAESGSGMALPDLVCVIEYKLI